MPPLSLMIKPASGNCNMRCRYCFYADEVQNRKVASYGIMTVETLEKAGERELHVCLSGRRGDAGGIGFLSDAH